MHKTTLRAVSGTVKQEIQGYDVGMDAPTEKTAKPRRRGFRFRLQTLLIVVTVLSVPLGWVGWRLGQVRREQATITWIKEMGGRVYFQHSVPERRLYVRRLFGGYGADERFGTDERSWWDESTDNWLGERVWGAKLSNTQVSDLSPLAELKNLKGLHLINTPVSDLSLLAELKNLELLYLRNTMLSTEQVQELQQALPKCSIEYSINVEKIPSNHIL